MSNQGDFQKVNQAGKVFSSHFETDQPGNTSIDTLAQKIKTVIPPGKRVAFVSGNFNIVHPGHIRLLNFAAECADFLIVGVCDDTHAGTSIPEQLRLEGIRAIGCVDVAVLIPPALESFLAHLKPDIVVKGSEHEKHFNKEKSIVENYGGTLLFSSGEMGFSTTDLLRRELQEITHSTIKKPRDYLHRHQISADKFPNILRRFTELNVLVLGDLIIDEYVTCDTLGLSREDPTIVVTPIHKEIFLGGAGIVSAHAKSLGANVKYFSVIGNDETATFAHDILKKYGVEAFLITDGSRPTTLKQRFRTDGKTLLRVSHLRHHHIGSELSASLFNQLKRAILEADIFIFSDFNYGCLPQHLVNDVVSLCAENNIPMVADSQSSSQIGDISRFHNMLLITPTEHEARLAVRDQTSGLIVLADTLCKQTGAKHVFITLGANGLLVHSPESKLVTDQLPAFNTVPKDISGGGDCLLITAALALAAGASIWESAYLGSIAAACHVGRVGNLPLSVNDVLQELNA